MRKLDLTEEERKDYDWICNSSKKERFKERHPGKTAEYSRDYSKRHPGLRKQQAAERRARIGKAECNRRSREWCGEHPVKVSAYRKKWRVKNPNYMSRYYQKNKGVYRENYLKRKAIPEKKEKYKATAKKYKKTVLKHNLNYQIKEKLRGRIKMALKLNAPRRAQKACKTEELLGCSVEFFKNYIASKFQSGMAWNNHAHDTWHLDHVKACKHFDLLDPDQQKECFHYTNYQPLWGPDNLRKGSKIFALPEPTSSKTQLEAGSLISTAEQA
jgi:Prasinovirus endonuclease VII